VPRLRIQFAGKIRQGKSWVLAALDDAKPKTPEPGPESIVEIRPNKRWLAKRRRELLSATGPASALLSGDALQWISDAAKIVQRINLKAVEVAIKKMSTPEGAAAFKKAHRAAKKAQKEQSAVERQQNQIKEYREFFSKLFPPGGIPMGGTGVRVVEALEKIIADRKDKRPKRAVTAESRPARKTATRKP
jgi:hypothetical protein